MNGRRLIAFAALALIGLGCEGHQLPTATSVPTSPSDIISDGAHGGNPDFFFLPPMVPFPSRNPDFELGKFNNTLKPSLKIEICELKSENLTAQGYPSATTGCVAGAPIKTFAPGSVQLVNLPLRQNGWWSLFGLPADGFYYVLWDTRQSNLNVNKYYRIKVLLDGSATPLGIADVDPMSNLFQWKYTATGDVVQLIDDVLLPIPFRVEKGGGPVLCGAGSLCNSVTVTNNSPTGSQIVTVDGGGGSIAGAKFPNGWLPAGGPQSVVVTISQVSTGANDPVTGAETTPCHVDLPLLQFQGCFRFTTTPPLPAIDESGNEFAAPVTVAVCYTLQNSGDPREKFAEMWSSGPNEPAHPLDDASDVGLLAANSRNCTNNIIGSNNSNGATGFASTGWRKFKGGLNRLFGVQTAYAVDLGLGGITKKFSNVGPALTAQIGAYTSTSLSLSPGATTTSTARILGSNHHDTHALPTGIGGLPVTFTVGDGNGTLLGLGSEGAPTTTVTVITNTNPVDGSPTSGGGFAPVNWTVPATPGVYTLTATGPAMGGPVTFTTTVVPPNVIGLAPTERRMLSMQTGASIQLGATGPTAVASWTSSAPQNIQISPAGLATAIVGGENIAGNDTATITSTLVGESAGPTLLVDSFRFDIFPRTTTLSWVPVAGAVSYQVVTEFGNASATNPFCTVPADCGIWTPGGPFTTTGLTTTIGFVGAQPGRWRVTALNAAGGVISTSPYIYFAYLL
jgi:hypothetical protein